MSKITNEMRFKTAEERVKAFGEFCKNEFCNQCNHLDCKLHKQGSAILHCYDGWLALEADEEKPDPCPFCGSQMGEGQSGDNKRVLICDNRNCGYITPKSNTRAEAVAAHNRVARAVRAAKKGVVEMSADEIRRLAERSKEIAELPDDNFCVSIWDEEHQYQVEKPTKEVRSALLAFAAMVERCEKRRYENMDLIDYILKGENDEH